MQKALITGITGQDGAYLAKSLLEKGIEVFGGQRRSTALRYWRLDEMGITKDIEFVELDLLDHANIRRAVEKVEPEFIYNLAAQSFVALSFEQPELTTLIDAMGVLRCLEAIKQVNPKVITVFGGPNYPITSDEQKEFYINEWIKLNTDGYLESLARSKEFQKPTDISWEEFVAKGGTPATEQLAELERVLKIHKLQAKNETISHFPGGVGNYPSKFVKISNFMNNVMFKMTQKKQQLKGKI